MKITVGVELTDEQAQALLRMPVRGFRFAEKFGSEGSLLDGLLLNGLVEWSLWDGLTRLTRIGKQVRAKLLEGSE